MTVSVGCIADDFTGALDLANNLARAGLRTVQVNGVPTTDTAVGDADAVVVALKSRSLPAATAVAESVAALRWLRDRGVAHFYVKYCSTFDSTPTGNIGPVLDAVLDELGEFGTIVVPAFPAAGRTVYQGHLFVFDCPLDESSMRNHPLTPMTDSSVLRLLAPQTRRQVDLLDHTVIRQGAAAVESRLAQLLTDTGGVGNLVVTDAISDADLATIAQGAAALRVVSGGSGLAEFLPAAWHLDTSRDAAELPPAAGAGAVLAGSVSHTTNLQVASYPGPKRDLDPTALLEDPSHLGDALDWACAQISRGKLPLVYSTAEPDAVAHAAAVSKGRAAHAVEEAMSAAARVLVEKAGVRRLIVAGGETAGACVQGLGIAELRIGPQIDPGVPWAWGQTRVGGIHLALKSGNFGGPDFFRNAFGLLDG